MGNRKYMVASCSVGGHVSAEMERSLRNGNMKVMEFYAGILREEDPEAAASVQRVQSMVRAGALEIGSVHIPYGELFDPSAADEDTRKQNCENIRNIVRQTIEAGLGAPAYTLHGGMEPTLDEERPHRTAQSRKSLAELAPFFTELGATVNVELLPRSCIGNCPAELKAITDGQAECVGICVDVNHYMSRYKEVPSVIRQLAPRIHSFHLSDYDGVDEQHWLIPHQGVLNWHEIMKEIKAIPQDLNMIFECRYRNGVDWRENTRHDATVRIFEYSKFYLENVEKFEALDAEFEEFCKS